MAILDPDPDSNDSPEAFKNDTLRSVWEGGHP